MALKTVPVIMFTFEIKAMYFQVCTLLKRVVNQQWISFSDPIYESVYNIGTRFVLVQRVLEIITKKTFYVIHTPMYTDRTRWDKRVAYQDTVINKIYTIVIENYVIEIWAESRAGLKLLIILWFSFMEDLFSF